MDFSLNDAMTLVVILLLAATLMAFLWGKDLQTDRNDAQRERIRRERNKKRIR